MQTTKTCMELIDELTRQANQFTQVQSKLRKEVNLFTGHFDEDNTFKFRVNSTRIGNMYALPTNCTTLWKNTA